MIKIPVCISEITSVLFDWLYFSPVGWCGAYNCTLQHSPITQKLIYLSRIWLFSGSIAMVIKYMHVLHWISRVGCFWMRARKIVTNFPLKMEADCCRGVSINRTYNYFSSYPYCYYQDGEQNRHVISDFVWGGANPLPE